MHAVIEQDDAVGDVLLQPVPGQLPCAALAGDHGGHPALLEPGKQPAQLRAQHALIGEARKQGFGCVEHHATRADRVDGMAEADEQALEVVLAGLLDLATLDPHVVDQQSLLGDQARYVVAERGDIGSEVFRAFLEAHQHAGLAKLPRTVDQEGHGKERFAAAGTAADQGRPPLRQPAKGDRVEAVDPGRCLGQGLRRTRAVHDGMSVAVHHAS